MALSPTSSRGGFSGGTVPSATTIQDTLTVTPPTGHQGVVITGVDSNTTKLVNATAGHTVFTVDSDGTALFSSDDTMLLSVAGTGTTPGWLNVSGSGPGGVGAPIYSLRTDEGLTQLVGSNGVPVPKGLRTNVITSGALPTLTPASGTAQHANVNRDVFVVAAVTFNSTAGAAATCLVELSPDNVTYSALVTVTEPAGVALAGTIIPVSFFVPANWWFRLTVTNATIGATTAY